MFPHCRKLVAVAFVALAVLSLRGYTEPDDLARHKMNVVRAALSGVPQQEQQSLLDAATRAQALTGLECSADADGAVLAIRTTGEPSYATFHVGRGKVFVIDLQDTVNFKAGNVLSPDDNTWIRRIRTSLFQCSPAFVSRVAVETTRKFQPEIRQTDGLIEIKFGAGSLSAKASAANPSASADPLADFCGELDKLCAPAPEPAGPADVEQTAPQSVPGNELQTLTNDLASNFSLATAKPVSPIAPAAYTTRKTAYYSSPMEVVVALPVNVSTGLTKTMATPIQGDQPVDAEKANLEAPALEPEAATALDSMQQLFDTLSARESQNAAASENLLSGSPLPAVQTEAVAPFDLAAAEAPQAEAAAEKEESSEAPAEPEGEAELPEPPGDAEKPVEPAETPELPEMEPEPVEPEEATAAPEAEAEPAEAEAAPEAGSVPRKAPAQPTAAPEIRVDGELIAIPATTAQFPEYEGDPLNQPVNIDFREMELSNVVALLAHKAQINVVAGTEVIGTVTASLKNVPLRQALETLLRLNGLGIVEEAGIFRIVTYEEALAARRETRMVFLENAQANNVKATLDTLVTGMPQSTQISVAADEDTNVIILMGPEKSVEELEKITSQLDVSEQILPTVTDAIKLNYSNPEESKLLVESMLTPEVGTVEADPYGRHIIVTDYPVVIEQVRELIAKVDIPVKQVNIEALIVDAVLRDASQTGVNWTVDVLRRYSRNGELVSNLQQLTMDATMGNIGTDALDAGVLTVGILSSDVQIEAAIAAEVQSRNAEILANPVVVAAENKEAEIAIVQDFPYQEITQTTQGPPVASTAFKPIGVTLTVTPRVTHQDDILIDLEAKQSSISGITEDGIPIEDKREASTSLRTNNGRTVFIGGLRNVTDRMETSKIPILGDIPVLNFAFRDNDIEKINTELLIFLTCNVMGTELPELTPSEERQYNKIDTVPRVPDSQRALFRGMARPEEFRDPAWKWRRSE